MAGLIERIAKTSAVLTQPTGAISDGTPVTCNVSCRVFGAGGVAQTGNEYGQVACDKFFLVAPLANAPVLPATITVDNVSYTVQSIKPYKNLKGDLLGYRLSAAGGS